jgi:hypothetical protein
MESRSIVRPHLPPPSFGHREPVADKELIMSDDKKKVGKPDRDRVSGNEPYEVGDLAKKHQMPAPLVKKVIEQVGPMRKDVEKKLEDMKKNRK